MMMSGVGMFSPLSDVKINESKSGTIKTILHKKNKKRVTICL